MHSATSPTGMMSFTTTYAPKMMARSSCANGRNSSEKNCASHEKSCADKCSKADRESLIHRSGVFSLPAHHAGTSGVADMPPLRALAAFLFRSGHGQLQSCRRLLSLTCRPYKFLVNLGQNAIPHKELLVVASAIFCTWCTPRGAGRDCRVLPKSQITNCADDLRVLLEIARRRADRGGVCPYARRRCDL